MKKIDCLWREYVFSAMDDDKKKAIYYLVGTALDGKIKGLKGLIEYCGQRKLVPGTNKNLYSVLMRMTEEEDRVLTFLVNQAISDSKETER